MNYIGAIGLHGSTPAQQNFDADDAIGKVVVTAENVAVECAARTACRLSRACTVAAFSSEMAVAGPLTQQMVEAACGSSLRDSLGDKPAFQ